MWICKNCDKPKLKPIDWNKPHATAKLLERYAPKEKSLNNSMRKYQKEQTQLKHLPNHLNSEIRHDPQIRDRDMKTGRFTLIKILNCQELRMALKLYRLLDKHGKLKYYPDLANFYGLGTFT